MLGGNQDRGLTRSHLRSRYADLQAFMSRMRNNMKRKKRTSAALAEGLWILAAKGKKGQGLNYKTGNKRNTSLRTACRFLSDTTGGHEVKGGEEKGKGVQREQERIQRDRKWGERVAQLPLQSKWSILSFLLCVRGCPQRWWWLCQRQVHRPPLWPRLSSTFLRKWKKNQTSIREIQMPSSPAQCL